MSYFYVVEQPTEGKPPYVVFEVPFVENGFIEVTEEFLNEYLANMQHYKIVNGEILPKNHEDYEKEQDDARLKKIPTLTPEALQMQVEVANRVSQRETNQNLRLVMQKLDIPLPSQPKSIRNLPSVIHDEILIEKLTEFYIYGVYSSDDIYLFLLDRQITEEDYNIITSSVLKGGR